ncbi:TrmH family RNA methyltransferase [Peribacillus sp. SCS-37]|uniref:TrmH family RNA methyltransferase n=1 Tax=Paraperibacillus esterisolvens TaxID=3115296 RepID=UPI0039059A61
MKYIESPKNPSVKQWKKLLTKKERDKTGKYLIEGFHLVEEALKEKDLVLEIILQEDIGLPSTLDLSGQDITYVSAEVMRSVSDTEAPQGIAAICEQRHAEAAITGGGQFLLVDAVQDPGNLGTMIRTADAAGMDGVILGEGSADPYNPKVIRSTQGSLFHIPVVKSELSGFMASLKEKGIPVYGTSLKGAVPFETAEKQERFALLVGNEGKGVDDRYLAETNQNLYIPLYGRSESLNVAVAAGILLYHLKK